jgi:hypothetical protein
MINANGHISIHFLKVFPLKDKDGKTIGSVQIFDDGTAVLNIKGDYQIFFQDRDSISVGYEVKTGK